MASPYPSFTPSFDGATGDVRVLGGTYVAGAPKLQKVMFLLATPLGTYQPDRTIGVNFAIAKRATSGLVAAWKAEVARALAPLTGPREIELVRIPVEINFDPRRAGALLYGVVFRDPLDPSRAEVSTPRLVA